MHTHPVEDSQAMKQAMRSSSAANQSRQGATAAATTNA